MHAVCKIRRSEEGTQIAFDIMLRTIVRSDMSEKHGCFTVGGEFAGCVKSARF